MVYEATTGKKLGQALGPLNNIIPPSKLLEMYEAIHPDLPTDVPLGKIQSYDDALTYCRRAAFHAVGKIRSGDTSSVNHLFVISELTLKDGTEQTRSLQIHFLEDFQTIFLNEQLDFAIIVPKMHPLTQVLWKEIGEYWQAAASFKYNRSRPQDDDPCHFGTKSLLGTEREC